MANPTKRCPLNPLELAHTLVNALEDKKGEDILLLDLQKVASFTDYFVICSGSSDRMLDALADSALEKAREIHRAPGRKEGRAAAGWLVVDFGAVVVHVFAPEQREFYGLEELWREGKILLRLQ
jgi:ribosome-associated protein